MHEEDNWIDAVQNNRTFTQPLEVGDTLFHKGTAKRYFGALHSTTPYHKIDLWIENW